MCNDVCSSVNLSEPHGGRKRGASWQYIPVDPTSIKRSVSISLAEKLDQTLAPTIDLTQGNVYPLFGFVRVEEMT
jgi:hypothetical protein